MPGFISTGSTIAAEVRDDFMQTYDPAFDGVSMGLDAAMRLDVPFNHRVETFGMIETIGYPERFDEGNEAIPEEGTGSLSFTVTTYDYGKRVSWKVKDREDNKVGDLRAKAMNLGRHFNSVPSRVFIELITASASLLPTIPNAPDGAAVYSATDGDSAARFGITGGNLYTGTGVATEGAIETDFFGATARMVQFNDIKGQPYWEHDAFAPSYTIFYNPANNKVFVKAFAATVVHSISTGTDTTDPGTGAGVSNAILASGVTVRLVANPRITDNDWFIFRNNPPVHPFFRGTRRTLTMEDSMMGGNSTAVTQTFAKEWVQFTTREAYGVNVPFSTVKVNN